MTTPTPIDGRSVAKNTLTVCTTGITTAVFVWGAKRLVHQILSRNANWSDPTSAAIQVVCGVSGLVFAHVVTSFLTSLIQFTKTASAKRRLWSYDSLQMFTGAAALIKLGMMAWKKSNVTDMFDLAIPFGVAGCLFLTPLATKYGKEFLVYISIIGSIAGCLQRCPSAL